MKKLLTLLVCALCILTAFTSCDKTPDDIATGLPAPTGLRTEAGYVTWNPVDHAVKYTISVDGKEYYCDENKYPISSIADGEHRIKVKANGDDILYKTSPFSEDFALSLVEGGIASSGYYSQFDELTMQESFLGYGFDVINSSVFYDKTVKTSSPIFKTDELMNLRLLKVDSKRSYVEEIQSEDIKTFMQSWNTELNVDVEFDGLFVAGSVDVNAAYSGGSQNAKSKYFHCITFNNQDFYIVMQGTTDDYRAMLSEAFEKDLYSNMSPAELFNKYGTHFITSALMGGKINSYYLYTSDEEMSFHDISASVSADVRYWSGSTSVNVSGGYRQKAESQNIFIKNTLEVIGGGDFGFRSDADIATHYAAWEKSLDDHASLIGIKDSGSLWPIWDLIDPAKDTSGDYQWIDSEGNLQTGSRAEQLQGYFMKYGLDNYNMLAKNAGIPEIKQPTDITNILVNGRGPGSNGEYEVFAGNANRVTFTVEPEDAIGYTKFVRLTSPNAYVTINDDNTEIVVSDNAPHNTVFSVVVSAGDIKETITLRVTKTYTVTFETNMDDVTIANPEKYQSINYGRQIVEPTIVGTPMNYRFLGWYKDAYFIDEYVFGQDPITDNITLYAKWEKIYPVVSFIGNVDGFSLEDAKVEFGGTLDVPSAPKATGYTFIGWYTDNTHEVEFDFTSPIVKNIVIFAYFVENPKVTFISNADGGSIDSITVEYNKIPSIPTTPTLNGYTFVGYYKDEAFSEKFDFYEPLTNSVNVYMRWEKNPKITFASNIGGVTFDSVSVAYDTTFNPTNPAVAGYNFAGFYTDDSCTVAFDFTVAIKADTVVYVKLVPQKYTVSFVSNGGTAIADISADYGSKISEPTEPTRTGYEFLGWYKDSAFNSVFDFHVDTIGGNTTLYAKWGRGAIEISFDSCGGDAIGSQKLEQGDTLGENLPTPTREGYTFAGWYTSSDYSSASRVYSNTEFIENKTLFAKWNLNTYTVLYNANGGTGTMESSIHTYGVSASLSANDFKKTGYTFVGWSVDKDANYAIFSDKQEVTNLALENGAKVTLYAIWTANTYTVAFDANGGAALFDNKQVTFAGYYGELPTAERRGYSFVGWYTAKSGGTRVDSTVMVTTAANHTLYARWNAKTYTVSYDLNGGLKKSDGIYPITYTVESGLSPSELTDTYFAEYNHFVGWYLDEDFDTPLTNEILNSPDNITLYAKWDRCTIYDSIDSTPWSTSGRVIIDWRLENDTNLLNHTARAVANSRYNNIDISNKTTEIIFIGDPAKTYTNFRMYICEFAQGQQLTIRFVDFNFVTNETETIGVYNDAGSVITIDIEGSCSIGTSVNSGTIINLPNNDITFVGAGELNVRAGNGASATTAGGNGANGGVAIIANNVTVDMTGKLNAFGGNGGNGGTGSNGANGSGNDSPGSNGTNGGNGGKGASALKCTSITVSASSNVSLTAGNGGNGGAGGRGGDGTDDDAPASNRNGHGGNGGNGGNGGSCAEALVASDSINGYEINCVSGIVGAGGRGGNGGDGGDTKGWFGGEGSAGGKGGTGGLYGDGVTRAANGSDGSRGA